MRRRSRRSPPGVMVTSTAELPCSATPTTAVCFTRAFATSPLGFLYQRGQSQLIRDAQLGIDHTQVMSNCCRCRVHLPGDLLIGLATSESRRNGGFARR